MLTSCTWQRRSVPKCVRCHVLPHRSDFNLLAVASVPAPSLDKTCTQSLDPCAFGVEPFLHRDQSISGFKPHRYAVVQQCERAQTHHGVRPRLQRVFAQSDVHGIVEIHVPAESSHLRIGIKTFAQIDVQAIVEIHVSCGVSRLRIEA